MPKTIWREIATHVSEGPAVSLFTAEDMKTEAKCSLVPVYQTTWRHIPKYRNLNTDSRENHTTKESTIV
jgi:hypothetical protein